MKVSYKTDYALKTLLELALKYNNVVSIQALARRGDIPYKFLEQVLLVLKKGGFVDSKRGVNGGYFLSKPPEYITIGDVVRFIEGPVEPIPCVGRNNYEACKDFEGCVFKDVWSEVNKSVSGVIDRVTFAELVKKSESRKTKKESYSYFI
jgi:Rrf2 family transcriptional regulator, cysteine metabolism repressor